MKTIEEIKKALSQEKAHLKKRAKTPHDYLDYDQGTLDGWIEALKWVLIPSAKKGKEKTS